LEWHKRKYGEWQRWLNGRNVTVTDRLNHVWCRIWDRDEERAHVAALIRFGYFEVSTFSVSNEPLAVMCSLRNRARQRGLDIDSIFCSEDRVRVIAKKKDMRAVEELIRQADVPENVLTLFPPGARDVIVTISMLGYSL
jgi:hypothetical protein